MSTTIHIEEETKQILETVKIKERASSLNETILKLLEKVNELPVHSMFGIDRGKKIKVEKIKTHEI